MMRQTCGLVLAALLGVPAALSAQGTSYVLIGDSDDAREVLLSVHNPTGQGQSFEVLPIAAGTNGVHRSTSPTRIDVPAGRTMVYSDLAGGGPSMVEVTAHGELTFQAYLMPLNSSGSRVGLRQQIPIVDSGSLIRGGNWAYVTGLRRDSNDRSDYAILNLSHSTNTCEHRVRSREGYWARESTVLKHPPLSLTYVADVLAVVGVELGDRYTISTNCDDSFYVAALVSDDRNDRLTVLEPSQSGVSSLAPPGYGEPPPTPNPGTPDPPPPAGCPSGWTCLSPDRTSHTVRRQDLQYIFRAGLEAGSYRSRPTGVQPAHDRHRPGRSPDLLARDQPPQRPARIHRSASKRPVRPPRPGCHPHQQGPPRPAAGVDAESDVQAELQLQRRRGGFPLRDGQSGEAVLLPGHGKRRLAHVCRLRSDCSWSWAATAPRKSSRRSGAGPTATSGCALERTEATRTPRPAVPGAGSPPPAHGHNVAA